MEYCFFNDDYGTGFWIRIFGYGIHVSNEDLIFSERNGYTKYVRLFGWKAKLLKPNPSGE